MRILQVHNAYRQPGGEDSVVAAEAELLRKHQHEVRLFSADNDDIGGPFSQLVTAWRAPYSAAGRRRLERELGLWRPDVVHVHNFFPQLTPAVFDACRTAGVPSVMTLHNFRLLCPAGLLWRQGKVCEDCLGTAPWRAVLHRCYRDSLPGSFAVARMVEYHRRRRTWQQKVDRFIVMSELARHKLIAAGWKTESISVKPHFCLDPDKKPGAGERQGALFAGRLSQEKGLKTLLTAWRTISHPLRLAGDGPLREEVEGCGNAQVHLLGWLPQEALSAEMRQAVCLIVPSEWYETFGMVAIEAFAHGLPVVAARIGALAELVEDGVTGLLFEPGDAEGLTDRVRFLLEHPAETARLGKNARAAFVEKFTGERNYSQLMCIYKKVIYGTNRKKADSRPSN